MMILWVRPESSGLNSPRRNQALARPYRFTRRVPHHFRIRPGKALNSSPEMSRARSKALLIRGMRDKRGRCHYAWAGGVAAANVEPVRQLDATAGFLLFLPPRPLRQIRVFPILLLPASELALSGLPGAQTRGRSYRRARQYARAPWRL